MKSSRAWILGHTHLLLRLALVPRGAPPQSFLQ